MILRFFPQRKNKNRLVVSFLHLLEPTQDSPRLVQVIQLETLQGRFLIDERSSYDIELVMISVSDANLLIRQFNQRRQIDKLWNGIGRNRDTKRTKIGCNISLSIYCALVKINAIFRQNHHFVYPLLGGKSQTMPTIEILDFQVLSHFFATWVKAVQRELKKYSIACLFGLILSRYFELAMSI